MSDSEWDKNEIKIGELSLKPIHGVKWEGEDEDDDVKDNWDDDDGGDGTAEGDPKGARDTKGKSEPQKEKIASKKKKINRFDDKVNDSQPKTADEVLAEKLERQRMQEESDLILAKEAFGVSNEMLDSNLTSRDEFDNFKKSLVEKLSTVERSPHYVPFLENMFRELCVSLEPDDIKRISSNLNALFNEKVKAQKVAKPKKKGKGYALKMERNDLEYNDGDDIANEYDDFM